MQVLLSIGMLFIAYLIGSIPFGLLIVKVTTGKDIRSVESGRTGGTNVMRAAGFWAGLITAILDLLKGAVVVWITRLTLSERVWLEVLSPVAAILGHNYSLFLTERDENGRLRLRGGAGGATCVGGSMGLWLPSVLITVPFGVGILYFVGYASLATMSVALISSVIFAYRAWVRVSPWQYAIYGIIAWLVLVWGLRPNIRRLFNGTERLVGLRAKRGTDHRH